MKETPLLMRGPLVLETLVGRKTQTRRVMSKLLVDVPRKVCGDVPGYGTLAPGRHKAVMNKLGAVSCDLGNGKFLGLKPGEFNWVCPYCEGETECTESGWVIRPKESRLWVKETWVGSKLTMRGYFRADMQYWDHATNKPRPERGMPEACKWKPSLFMPRWASRLTLEITEVRVQRVQDISDEDAEAEGMERCRCTEGCDICAKSFSEDYADFWDSINRKRAEGKYAWDQNPFVWAIEFKRI